MNRTTARWPLALMFALAVAALVAVSVDWDSSQEALANSPTPTNIATVDSGFAQGISMELDLGGNPMISYVVGNSVKYAKCGSLQCTSPFITTVGTLTSSFGTATSIAIDPVGRPVIAYNEGSPQRLKIVHCGDTTCTSGNVTNTPDPTDSGRRPSLELDASGYPVIVSESAVPGAAEVVRCNDANCAGNNESVETITLAGEEGPPSMELDLVSNASGFPVFSINVSNGVDGDLYLVHCNDVNCAGDNESEVLVDAAGNVGHDSSLKLTASAIPVISHWDNGNDNLRLVRCTNVSCTSSLNTSTIDTVTGANTSIALDSGSNPVISYNSGVGPGGYLRVMNCDDLTCSGTNDPVTTAATSDDVETALQLDVVGNPLVAFEDDNSVKLLSCSNVTCSVDTDGDALLDSWELSGDLDSNGSMDVNLPAMGADPKVKDLFVEADWMDCGVTGSDCAPGHSDRPLPDPSRAAFPNTGTDPLTKIMVAFACAPTPINIHIDVGPQSIMEPIVDCDLGTVSDASPEWGGLSQGSGIAHDTAISLFDFPTFKAANFSATRADVFHYAIFAHGLTEGYSGYSFGIPASDFVMALGSWTFPLAGVNTERWQAESATFMHELGHNLALGHGGQDHENFKPNYLSVMNYSFSSFGILVNGTIGERFDYSRFSLDSLNENSLNETAGLGPDGTLNSGGVLYGTVWRCANSGGFSGYGYSPDATADLDFDCDSVEDGDVSPPGTCMDLADNGGGDGLDYTDLECPSGIEASVAVDVNSTGTLTTLVSYDDWSNIVFGGGSVGAYATVNPGHFHAPGTTPHLHADITEPEAEDVAQLFPDLDLDGLPTQSEAAEGTNPNDSDSDNDGTEDGREVGTLETDPLDADSDGDGCSEGQELGLNPVAGGMRHPRDFWDFFDTPGPGNVRDKAVAGTDFFSLLARFGSSGNPNIDPLSAPPAAPAYHPAFDRSSVPTFLTGPPDGSVAGTDFFEILAQFGHTCA